MTLMRTHNVKNCGILYYMAKLSMKLSVFVTVFLLVSGQVAEAATPVFQALPCLSTQTQMQQKSSCCDTNCDCSMKTVPERSEALVSNLSLSSELTLSTILFALTTDKIAPAFFDKPTLEFSPPALPIYQRVSSYRL